MLYYTITFYTILFYSIIYQTILHVDAAAGAGPDPGERAEEGALARALRGGEEHLVYNIYIYIYTYAYIYIYTYEC